MLSFRTLHESPLVSVQVYSCRAGCCGPAAEEESPDDSIVLMHRGAFRRHFGSRSVTADVNQATFFTKGSTYRVSHPVDCGDRGTIIRIAPRILRDLVREIDPSVDDRSHPFPFAIGPCSTAHYWRHHEVIARLGRAESLEPLWADVAALQLAADVLDAAFERHGLAPAARRAGTAADHADVVESAKSWMAAHLAQRLTLDDVARAVHCSPFHFARMFQRHAGVPVHRYLLQLRLRAALLRLEQGEGDIAGLALELGFAGHAHFSDAFRREFGRPPSRVRQSSKVPKA